MTLMGKAEAFVPIIAFAPYAEAKYAILWLCPKRIESLSDLQNEDFMSRSFLAWGLMGALVLTAGCVPRDETPDVEAEASPEQVLLDEWLAAADNPRAAMQDPRIPEIALTLAMEGEEALQPALEVLAASGSGPGEKFVITQGLGAVLRNAENTDGLLAQIVYLTEEQFDDMTRACALQLLAMERDDRFESIFVQHTDAEDPRVKLAALSGLSILGNEEGREGLRAYARDHDAPVDQRIHALVELATTIQSKDVPLFMDAIEDEKLPMSIRIQLLSAISMVAGPDALDQLQEMVDDESTDAELRATGRAVIAAIETRHGMN